MGKFFALYNPYAGNNTGEKSASALESFYDKEQLIYVDILEASRDYSAFLSSLSDDDTIILCGGDGTINRFVNDLDEIEVKNEILYYACGSGNDFLHDVGIESNTEPFSIKKYIKDLPEVCVNGKTYKFLNGIGYGIDGYCCEEGDRLRKKSDKPINYAVIAIKGLLFYYKPTNATVTVDGVKHEYKKVWLAPTMNGRFYGGGMMPTPDQDRLGEDKSLSVLVWHGSGKIPTLAAFPGIFGGTHIKHKKMCEVLTGKEITVEFDRPVAAQVDGETILNVLSYKAVSKVTSDKVNS